MIVTIEKSVNSCNECPHRVSSMDGPYCPKLFKVNNWGGVYPEGRTKIHPQCPLNKV